MLAALLCSTTVWAESYGITVAGVSVTDANKSNITGSGISGKVTYDPTNKRLELADGTVITTSSDGIANRGIDGLSIIFNGTVTINTSCTTASAAAIFCSKNTSLSCWSGVKSPVLKLNNTGAGNAIRSYEGANISAYNMRITAKAANNDAVRANGAAQLDLNYSRLEAEAGSGYAGITGFTNGLSMNFSGFPTSVITNSSYSFNSSKGGVVDGSGNLVQKAVIAPSITIGATNVGWNSVTLSTSNTGASSASGKATLNPSTKTLTLTDFNLNGAGIVCRVPGLKIIFSGGGTLTNSNIALDLYGDTELTSDGTVDITASNSSAIYLNGAYNLTINMKEFSATSSGSYYGVNGSNYSGSKLTLNKYDNTSVYKFLGGKANLSVGDIVMNDMDVWTPNTYFNPTDHKLYYNGAEASSSNGAPSGTWFKSKSQFTYYPVYVAGVQVNNHNYDNITGPYITKGKASYDNSTKTLTLDNIKIDVTSTSDAAVKTSSAAGDFTLKFTGSEDAYLKSKSAAIDLSSNTTITGTSNVVRVESTNGSGVITRNDPDYVIIDVKGYFGVKGKTYGYYGEGSETLTLKKETSDTRGFAFEGEDGAVHAIKDLVLDNMDYGWAGNNGYYFADGDVRQNGGAIVKGLVEFGSIQEKLPIYICGKQLNKVTSNTGYTIYVGSPYISSGTKSVGYNPFTKTLTLNNAKITNDNPATSGHGAHAIDIDPGFEGTIKLIGANSIIDPHFSAVVHEGEATTTFAGEGSLYVKGNVFALMPWRGTMIFSDNVTVEAEATSTAGYGIGSNNTGTSGETIVIKDNAVVKTSSIGGLNTITLNDGQSIVEPAGAEIKNLSSGWAVCVGENVAKDVLIMKVEDYGLEVCDVAVNSYNYADPHRDGKFKYDSEAKTLTITGANIDDTSIKNVVTNINVDGLKVNFVGDNSFKVNENIFQLLKSTTITGTGTVTGELAAEDGFGIWYKADLDITLDGATFQFKGFKGVSGFYDATVNMTINSGKFIFEPTSATGLALEGLASLTLGTGMEFAEPVGGRYDTALEAVTVDGTSPYNGKVVIEGATAYDLWIAEKAVNSVNCKDILGDGVFAYDAASNTLTIKGNHTYTGDDYLVISTIADLTINVAGNSMLVSAADNTIIRLYANTTITGGKLTLMCTASSNDGLGIYISDGGILTLKDADIDVTGDGFVYGITGDSNSKLVIDNSNISASAHSYGAIYDWGGITLTNCYVETPRPSTVDDMGIADADGYVGSGDETATVVIKAGADAMDGIEAAETAPAEIYDVAGRKLDQTRRGINIVRTKNGKAVKVIRK